MASSQASTHDRRDRAAEQRSPMISAPCKIRSGGRTVDVQWAIRSHGGRDAEDTAVPVLPAQDTRILRKRSRPIRSKTVAAKADREFENYDLAHAPLRTAVSGRPNSSYDRCQAVPCCGLIEADSRNGCRPGSSTRTAKSSPRACLRKTRNSVSVAPPAAVAAFSEAFDGLRRI